MLIIKTNQIMRILRVFSLVLSLISLMMIISGIFIFKENSSFFIVMGCGLIAASMGFLLYSSQNKKTS